MYLVRLGLVSTTGELHIEEVTVSSGSEEMFIASAPVYTALIAVIFLKERLSTLAWVGMFVGIIEIFLITAGSKGTSFTISKGVIFILSASIVTSFFFVFQKSLLRCYRSNEITTYFTWGGTAILHLLPRSLTRHSGCYK